MDFVYVKSRGAHGVHHVGVFEAHVGSEREIWIGSDGSGMIRESRGPVSFYTEAGKARWEAAGRPQLESGPGIDLFAPGCLGMTRAAQEKLPSDPEALLGALTERGPLTLKLVYHLLGEALASPEFCRAAYEVAGRLPDVELLDSASDQLGRSGRGLGRAEHGDRLELIFNHEITELLGYQRYLIDPGQTYAPVGALTSWTAYESRQLVDGLPAGTPSIPNLPCSPPGAGRGFPIRPGFTITTGYVTDPLPHLAELHAQGVITDAEYESAKSHELS